MFEAAGLGRLDRPRARAWAIRTSSRTSTAGARSSSASRRPSRSLEIALVGKYIELPDAYLSVTEALRHAAWAHEVDAKVRWVDSEALTARERRRARSTAWPASSSRAASAIAASRARSSPPTSRATDRIPYLGLCLGLQCAVIEFAREVVGHARRQLDRVRHVHRAPGHRLHARPARHGGQGRHDAPRPVPGQADPRLEGRRGLRPGGHLRAPSPPLRGQQPLPPDARGGRHAPVRPVAGRPARRDRRAARTTRGSWPASSTRSSRAGPSGPHPLFDGFVGASIAVADGREPEFRAARAAIAAADAASGRWPSTPRCRVGPPARPEAAVRPFGVDRPVAPGPTPGRRLESASAAPDARGASRDRLGSRRAIGRLSSPSIVGGAASRTTPASLALRPARAIRSDSPIAATHRSVGWEVAFAARHVQACTINPASARRRRRRVARRLVSLPPASRPG